MTIARVAKDVGRWHNGRIHAERLTQLLSEYGVNQEEETYRNKMVKWGYLYFDATDDTYHLTDAGKQTATITITVPRLNSKEIQRDIVGRYVGYGDIIAVGEVQNDE